MDIELNFTDIFQLPDITDMTWDQWAVPVIISRLGLGRLGGYAFLLWIILDYGKKRYISKKMVSDSPTNAGLFSSGIQQYWVILGIC